ncbi:hypothetical protein JMJ58_00745 [Haloterrigena salifodinae]|uniref:Uncharacterized protein n=1 Tax=Haloterrigena salifodinae TaxID=2675099 RepID=A0A8T8E1T3_9EURY|nr:hypothetical protein [Haloterrigena salifodinae]QRV15463.1 hypothetical protein JMJ58_00745 [Haloterrigena salifodinae]
MRNKIVITNENEVIDGKSFNQEAALLGDNQIFQLAVVERFKYDHEEVVSQITHQNCGKVKNRRESDKLPDITIEGIVSRSQAQFLKEIHRETELMLTSAIYQNQ